MFLLAWVSNGLLVRVRSGCFGVSSGYTYVVGDAGVGKKRYPTVPTMARMAALRGPKNLLDMVVVEL